MPRKRAKLILILKNIVPSSYQTFLFFIFTLVELLLSELVGNGKRVGVVDDRITGCGLGENKRMTLFRSSPCSSGMCRLGQLISHVRMLLKVEWKMNSLEIEFLEFACVIMMLLI
ncbi:hypothetical protein CDAR_476071 [Caerostris darwini]|uniref:Uncharacterized protein n=1 Tax=Caerostris darwini TaxID=1538125 RepID=A0AAV4PB95_9ARAC|nr:hypothetical protein CDAR_476071 [Caerostris darwini]